MKKSILKLIVMVLLSVIGGCASQGSVGRSGESSTEKNEMGDKLTIQQVEIYPQIGVDYQLHDLSYSPDGKYILTIGSKMYETGSVKIWDAKNGRELKTIYLGPCNHAEYNPAGNKILLVINDRIRIVDVETGRTLRRLSGHDGHAVSAAFSPNGEKIVSGAMDGIIKIWDVASGQELRTINVNIGGINSVSWSPDGKYLASISVRDKNFRIWDAETGRQVKNLVTTDENAIKWSSDGERLIAYSQSRLTIWNTGLSPSRYTKLSNFL